jgi:hypothetical protein
MRKSKGKERRAVVLVDYKNASLAPEALGKRKIVDFGKIRDVCLEKIGSVLAVFLFIPDHWNGKESVKEAASAYGVFPILCFGIQDGMKMEDTVDGHMIDFVNRVLLDNPEITDFVLVGHDKHMNHWIQFARWLGKEVHVFAGTNLSLVLKDAIKPSNQYLLPVKEGEFGDRFDV